jgi:small subunit ribosomal protein S19
MSRSSAILPEFVGYRFDVHNGKKFFPIQVKDNMVGKKFGEFAPTRTYPKHPEKVTLGTGPPKK